MPQAQQVPQSGVGLFDGKNRERDPVISLPGNLIACPDCDQLQRIPSLPPGGKARCPRCGKVVAAHKPDSLDRTLALTVGAAIAFIVANVMPVMGLSAVGHTTSTTIIGGAYTMWVQGERMTGLLVGFCVVVAPAVQIGFMLAVLIAVRRLPAPSWAGTLLRWAEKHEPWAMVEVMMLGILVSLVKIAELAAVIPGVGMFSVGALILLLSAMAVTFNPDEAWGRIRWANREGPPASDPGTEEESRRMKPGPRTGAQAGLILCESCGLLCRAAHAEEPGHCPRCGEELALRRHNSIQRTWAFIIAAAICYLPANILPVMITTALGAPEEDTIISGVILLYTTGSWHLSLIVLIASVMIPLGKLIALSYLLITVQRGSLQSNRERGRLYRLIEIVGRWSMLDVFVATFVVALIQLQPLMSVMPGTGVLFFAAVVVLTMLGAESFDPRLIWDSRKERLEQDD